MEEVRITGKAMRVARALKSISIKEFSSRIGLSLNYCSMLEREEANMTTRNHYRILRELRQLGYSDGEIAAIMVLTENIKQ